MEERVLSLPRRTIDDWGGLRENATWCTHFNTLRAMPGASDLESRKSALLRELKLLCLFHGRHVVLADSDLINSVPFQALFMDERPGLHSAFASQQLVLALRDAASGLNDLNAQQGTRRADPAMARSCAPFAEKFDRFFEARGLVALEWELALSASRFASLVGQLLDHENTPLGVEDQDHLGAAVRAARDAESNGHLYFGHIYRHLRESTAPQEVAARCIEAVRTAHMLNTSLRLGLSPSIAMNDVNPTYGDYLANGKRPARNESLYSDVLDGPVPRLVLPGSEVDRMSFAEIESHQRTGEEIGYFAALVDAREAVDARDRAKRHVLFLEKLAAYMRAISREARFELIEWQRLRLQDHIAAITADENDLKRWCSRCVPIAVGSALGTLWCLDVAMPTVFSLLTPVSFAVGAAGGIAYAEIARQAERERATTKRALDGTIWVPILKRD